MLHMYKPCLTFSPTYDWELAFHIYIEREVTCSVWRQSIYSRKMFPQTELDHRKIVLDLRLLLRHIVLLISFHVSHTVILYIETRLLADQSSHSQKTLFYKLFHLISNLWLGKILGWAANINKIKFCCDCNFVLYVVPISHCEKNKLKK